MRKRAAKRGARRKPAAVAAAQIPKPRLLGLKSIDDRTAVFAFLVFLVVVFFIFDAIADQQARSKGGTAAKALTKDVAERDILSKLIIDSKEQDGTGFIVRNDVDPELLEHFASKKYEQMKAELGIDSDFVIHFEDMNGNIIPIGDRMCIGSNGASINGVPCS
ncbi:hypothetical protein HYU16_00195 [Candidatus Woesearchaeota archaeon]|nr:hypothetical protein [Candidatus Woesearchaeota archaeon]